MHPNASHVVIVGGGIAGLAAAYSLQKQAQAQNLALTYTLVERDSAFGGKIVTQNSGGFVIEGGPDSFITQKPWAHQLCHELGLEDRLIGTNDERRKVYIVHKNRLRPLPDGVMLIIPTRFTPFALSPLISPWGKLRMGLDLFIPPKKDDSDESLAGFIERRLGREALDKIAEPLMAGIYVADPGRLSLKSTFPRFITLEKKYGSLIKGMLAQMKARTSSSRPKLPLFMTLRGGLIELVDSLVSKLNGELLTGQNVTVLKFMANNSPPYQVEFANGQTRQAQAVIMTTPAFVTADLLKPHSDLLAEKLQAIRYISTATVSLAFKRGEVSHPLNGFGFVVPRSEPCQLMACTWVSTKFDHRAPVDQVLLRVFVGGYKHQELVDLPDDALVDLARRELKKIMEIEAQPTRQEIYRWQQGNAQYDVGHLDRIAEIEGLARETLPGLYLTGSAFQGVGLPDCIHQGEQTAQQVIQYLQASEMVVK
jgi:oxygen-dependent protoporphyrinogen oxidase